MKNPLPRAIAEAAFAAVYIWLYTLIGWWSPLVAFASYFVGYGLKWAWREQQDAS